MVVWARSVRIICPHLYCRSTTYSLPFSSPYFLPREIMALPGLSVLCILTVMRQADMEYWKTILSPHCAVHHPPRVYCDFCPGSLYWIHGSSLYCYSLLLCYTGWASKRVLQLFSEKQHRLLRVSHISVQVQTICGDRGISVQVQTICGDCGSTVVKVLCYKSEGRWFDSRWCHWNFSLT